MALDDGSRQPRAIRRTLEVVGALGMEVGVAAHSLRRSLHRCACSTRRAAQPSPNTRLPSALSRHVVSQSVLCVELLTMYACAPCWDSTMYVLCGLVGERAPCVVLHIVSMLHGVTSWGPSNRCWFLFAALLCEACHALGGFSGAVCSRRRAPGPLLEMRKCQFRRTCVRGKLRSLGRRREI